MSMIAAISVEFEAYDVVNFTDRRGHDYAVDLR
jgi:hypothetical protein